MAAQSSVEQLEMRRMNLKELTSKPQLVQQVLCEYEESHSKVEHLTLRKLTPGLKITIWGLRFYVVFMIVVVFINVFHTLHS